MYFYYLKYDLVVVIWEEIFFQTLLHNLYFIADDDIWEHIDVDADAHIGDLVEYKTSVLYHNQWVDSEWNKGCLNQNTP